MENDDSGAIVLQESGGHALHPRRAHDPATDRNRHACALQTGTRAAVSIIPCGPVRYKIMHGSSAAWMSHHGSTLESSSARCPDTLSQTVLCIFVCISPLHIYGVYCIGCVHAQPISALIHVYIVLSTYNTVLQT